MVLICVAAPTTAARPRGQIIRAAIRRQTLRAVMGLAGAPTGSATRQVMERALQHTGARLGRMMELGHTEAIKQPAMAGLGVAFVSVHAIRNEVADDRVRALRLRRIAIRRHFHAIHHDARALSASARAFIGFLEAWRLDTRHVLRGPRRRPR